MCLPNKNIFFIGGYDLEMIEIIQILKKNKIPFIDKNLSWGAKLSEYKKELLEYQDKFNRIYGIELIEDIPSPVNYYSIDHHNSLSYKPSSIEQIAQILAIKLSRYQQLIAENDKGYIPALIKAGASEKEIEEIRKADRKAQGVTEEDEKLAEKSIQEYGKLINNIFIVKSLTDKFSPITDKLFDKYKKILIYNDNTLTYYGQGKSLLVKHFQELILKNIAYSGGDEEGFFGIVENAFKKEDLMHIISEIIEIASHG